jgi:flagellar motor switch protein FliN/FliY
MSSGILSQEEIDALLRGEPASINKESDSEDLDEKLSDMEIDAIGEISNIGMGTAATTLSTLLGKRVSITTPRVKQITRHQLITEHVVPYVIITVRYTQGVKGANLLVMKVVDAAVIADLMMGNDGANPPAELDEIMLSAVGEAMNQMMGSTTTSLSTMFNKRIDISPPSLEVIQFSDTRFNSQMDEPFDNLIKISFRMVIEDLVDSEIMQLIPVIYAKDMVETLLGKMNEEIVSADPGPIPERPEPSGAAETGPLPTASTVPVTPAKEIPVAPPSLQPSVMEQVSSKPSVPVQPVQFAPLTPNIESKEMGNISLLMDVPLEISVELGRTRKTIKQILDLGQGSIIQLDRLAGEPVDLLVNGKLVAKGEVVVIDENFGIRVTSIVSRVERLGNLQ